MSLRKKARESLEEPEFEEIREISEERTRSAPRGPAPEDSRVLHLTKELDAVKASTGEKDRELAKRDREVAELRAGLERLDRDHEATLTELQSKIREAESNTKRARRDLAAKEAEG